MEAFERARSEEQKHVRIAAIVSACERLFDRQEFDEITLAAIAREAKFTRSNLYKYFKTREEIFLDLLKRDMRVWRIGVEQALAGKVLSVDAFAELWAERLNGQKRLLRLLSILYVHLEKNASLESLVAFKVLAHDEIGRLIAALCANFEKLTPEKAEEFLAVQIATASGLYALTHLTDKQKEAAAAAGLSCYDGQFESFYRNAVAHGLEGALAGQ